jgi:hypothetical protein
LKNKYLTLSIAILLGCVANFQACANIIPTINTLDSFPSFNHRDNLMTAKSRPISVKKDGGYDESKDPALRKGTENWEEPQGSFFVIPALVLALIAIVLFFSKK